MTDSLIGKLEALYDKDIPRDSSSDWQSAIRDAIAIIRQHEVDMGEAQSQMAEKAVTTHGACTPSPAQPREIRDNKYYESLEDNNGVDCFSDAMKAKLEITRNKGRHGWWNEKVCTIEELNRLLDLHAAKGDLVDIANFCMMLHSRGETHRANPPDQTWNGNVCEPEPVSIKDVYSRFHIKEHHDTMRLPSGDPCNECIRAIKAVLDAAGVKHVD